jgi:hypothetical protein
MGRVQSLAIDGVPVVTGPGPERTTAALVFGVGSRDETFATTEVTHLVEHLAMAAQPRTPLRSNAVTDVDTTAFYATGRPAAVGAFLEGICRALADLPTGRMATEVGVLQAEACGTVDSTVGALWAARFGLAGPGLAGAGGPGPQYLTEAAVREHARRWFVRGNAALWCSGPLPEGLRLPLLDGPRPVRVPPAARPQTGPVWTPAPGSDVGLLLTAGGAADPALRIGVEVLQERLRTVARFDRGLAYSVETRALELTADRREVAVLVGARRGCGGEVADVLWDALGSLCESGPTPGEVAAAVAGFAEEVDADARAVAEAELADAAYCRVSGLPFRPVHRVLATWRATPADRVAAALRQARPTAILAVPEGAAWTPPGGPVERRSPCEVRPQLPAGALFRPGRLPRLLGRSRRPALVVGERELAHRDADGEVHGIPWELVEAALPTDDGRGVHVVGRNLCSAFVHEEEYGRRAVAAVRARVPAHLWLDRAAAAPARGDAVSVR